MGCYAAPVHQRGIVSPSPPFSAMFWLKMEECDDFVKVLYVHMDLLSVAVWTAFLLHVQYCTMCMICFLAPRFKQMYH